MFKTDRVTIVRNYQFWFIIGLTLIIVFFYYSIRYIKVTDPEWNLIWHLVVFEYSHNVTGALFYIPFIYAALIFWWRGLLIVWLLSMVLILPRVSYMAYDTTGFVINVILLVIPLTIVIAISLLFQWRKAEKEAIIAREKGHQSYIAQIFEAQEDERKRIARELHDDTAQRLWIVANDIMKLAHSISPQAAQKFEPIKNTIMEISSDTKRLSHDLRPSILDNLGLEEALEWLVDQLNNEGIQAEVVVSGSKIKLNTKSEIMVFRFVQEALNNVRKHSNATKVSVNLTYTEETIKISIQDNGVGFHVPEDIGHFAKQHKSGIIGMVERSELLGGIFNIKSEPGKDTTISVEFNPGLTTDNQSAANQFKTPKPFAKYDRI